MKNLILFVSFVILLSCNKNKREFSLNEFPVKVGNWWEYLRDANGVKDTLKIAVVEEVSTGSFLCVISENNIVIDSSEINIQNNLLSYKGLSENETFSNYKLKMPFKKNDYWVGNVPKDTIRVTEYSRRILIDNKKYKSVFTIERDYKLGGGFYFTQKLFIGTGVGVIKQVYESFDGAYFHNETFYLLDYYVVK